MCVRVCIYIYIYVYIHIHIYIYIYICIERDRHTYIHIQLSHDLLPSSALRTCVCDTITMISITILSITMISISITITIISYYIHVILYIYIYIYMCVQNCSKSPTCRHSSLWVRTCCHALSHFPWFVCCRDLRSREGGSDLLKCAIGASVLFQCLVAFPIIPTRLSEVSILGFHTQTLPPRAYSTT